MDWPHNAKFTRVPESQGTGGQRVAGSTVTVYNGEADVHSNGRAQDVALGIETSKGSGRVHLPVSVLAIGLKPNDLAELVVGPDTYTGRVDRVDHTDDSCLVLYD